MVQKPVWRRLLPGTHRITSYNVCYTKLLRYEVRPKTKTTTQIIKFIKQNEGKSGIIYCLSRKKVEELAENLQVNGIKALAYHAVV